MSEPLLETVEIEPSQAAKHSIIWLHGLGADGNDFFSIAPELKLPEALAVRFVFPHAPIRPVTLNGGMAMRAWYDIISLDREGRQDEAGIRLSAKQIEALIARENERGVATENIILAGFSQGGAIALQTGLRHGEKLAGIMGLSTYLPLADKLPDERDSKNNQTPIFLAHGSFDPVLPFAMGEQSRDHLMALDYQVEWHSYPMQHQVNFDEIRDISTWIQSVFAAK